MEQKELKRKMREMLALQLLYYLEEETDTQLQWTGTKTNLIELTSYLYYTERVTNEYGIPVSMIELSRKVCMRFGMKPMKSLSRILYNINNVQGIRSQTLLSISIHEHQQYGRELSIDTMVSHVI